MCEWVALTRKGVQSVKGGIPRGEPGGVCTFKGRRGQEEATLGASHPEGSGRTS